jgi:hypothetical protein
MRRLLAFGGFTHDTQSVLATVNRFALVGVELYLNIGIPELSVAPFAYAKALFHDTKFALGHVQSLAHQEGWA